MGCFVFIYDSEYNTLYVTLITIQLPLLIFLYSHPGHRDLPIRSLVKTEQMLDQQRGAHAPVVRDKRL